MNQAVLAVVEVNKINTHASLFIHHNLKSPLKIVLTQTGALQTAPVFISNNS